jgi:putative ABC transport system permease protein
MLFRYATRELRNSPRFSLLFIANLTLGLLGFISLDALKRSFEDRLQGSARELLGADLSISARRKLGQEDGRP